MDTIPVVVNTAQMVLIMEIDIDAFNNILMSHSRGKLAGTACTGIILQLRVCWKGALVKVYNSHVSCCGTGQNDTYNAQSTHRSSMHVYMAPIGVWPCCC